MSALPSSAEIIIVGGGIIGCSVAYHLAKRGLDVLLLERHGTSEMIGGTLEGAGILTHVRLFMLAARLLGLDCGPMSGFDNAKLDAEFFGDTSIKSNFIFALGHGASEMLFPRAPRFEFGEACQFA